MTHANEDIIAAIVKRLDATAPGQSFSSNAVAGDLAGKDTAAFHPLMKPIRAAAVALAKSGALEIVRKGKPVDPDDFKGVYRMRKPAI